MCNSQTGCRSDLAGRLFRVYRFLSKVYVFRIQRLDPSKRTFYKGPDLLLMLLSSVKLHMFIGLNLPYSLCTPDPTLIKSHTLMVFWGCLLWQRPCGFAEAASQFLAPRKNRKVLWSKFPTRPIVFFQSGQHPSGRISFLLLICIVLTVLILKLREEPACRNQQVGIRLRQMLTLVALGRCT